MSRFLPQKMLFHAIPCAPQGEAITTSINYGADIPAAEREKLGMPPDEQTPLVFAATNLDKALAFTIIKGEKLFNTFVDSAQAEIAVVVDREKFMSRERNATIFTFPDDGFVQLLNCQNQSVSTKAVPFAKTEVAATIKSAKDMMRHGLQIFSFEKSFGDTYGDKDAEKLSAAKDDKEMLGTLSQLVKSGKVVWENHARNINPNPALAETMGLSKPLPAPRVKRTRDPKI